ncbi:MAG TPA: uroporphyrinogen-III synthase [Candidatus Saccharimonadales bacterium]|jgi:uroporphyrinogen-III synthase
MPKAGGFTVALTRSAAGNAAWSARLQAAGVQIYSLATIETVPLELAAQTKTTLKQLSDFDWIVFTSAASVRYFLSALNQLGIKLPATGLHVAAIGLQTARLLEENGIRVDFRPSRSTGVALGEELNPVQGRRILLPRSKIASGELPAQLRKQGGEVTALPLYTTRLIDAPDTVFARQLAAASIDCIIFASPSAVRGFFRRIAGPELLQKTKLIPVIAIGPTTAQALQHGGFQHIHVSREPSPDGILEILLGLIRQ